MHPCCNPRSATEISELRPLLRSYYFLCTDMLLHTFRGIVICQLRAVSLSLPLPFLLSFFTLHFSFFNFHLSCLSILVFVWYLDPLRLTTCDLRHQVTAAPQHSFSLHHFALRNLHFDFSKLYALCAMRFALYYFRLTPFALRYLSPPK